MASALNQTPNTGADAVWTLLQLLLKPGDYQPAIPPPAVYSDCGGCVPCQPICYDPCSLDSCSPWPGLECEPAVNCIVGELCAWKALQSGGGIGGRYTICGLIQTSAADFQVAGSWVALRTPYYLTSPRPNDGTVYHRQFTFQRGTDNTLWRIKYSARAGFTGGTPSAAETPSATDEQILLGGGTDAAPTYGTLLPADGTYRMQILSYDNGLVPGFYLLTYPKGNPTPNACFMLDPLAPGSYPVDDAGFSLEQDPLVIYLRTGADTLRAASLASESTGFLGWLNYGRSTAPAQAFTRLPAGLVATYDGAAALQVAIPRGLNQGVLVDGLDTARGTYLRRAALPGTTARKGDASAWLWNGIVGAPQGVLVGQKTLGGTTNPYFWLSIGDVLLRWDGFTKTVMF